jgi:hypothetical protein
MEVGGPFHALVSVTREKSLGYPLNRRLDGAQPEGFAKNMDFAFLTGFKTRTVQPVT